MASSWCILLVVVLCCFLYIGYQRNYAYHIAKKISHWHYMYYPLFKPIHDVRNFFHFKYYGKHSCFIDYESEKTNIIQNDTLNEQYASKKTEYVRIVCISDTHELHRQLNIPNGDILIHCGDILFADSHKYSESNSIQKLIDFNQWLGELPHRYKIIVGGNHDYGLEKIGQKRAKQILTNGIYLINEAINLDNIQFFCSPYSIPNSTFSPNKAFQCDRNEIGEIWRKIPSDIDILVTHHMVKGYLCNDKGCASLLEIIKNKCVKVKYSIFGHWHGTYGVKFGVENGKHFQNKYRKNVCFINASSVDNFLCAIHPPVVFDYYFD